MTYRTDVEIFVEISGRESAGEELTHQGWIAVVRSCLLNKMEKHFLGNQLLREIFFVLNTDVGHK